MNKIIWMECGTKVTFTGTVKSNHNGSTSKFILTVFSPNVRVYPVDGTESTRNHETNTQPRCTDETLTPFFSTEVNWEGEWAFLGYHSSK